MGVLVPGGLTGLMNQPSAQIIDGSLKFDAGKTQYLTRTPSSDGNKRTWTWSGWVKPAAGALGNASGSALFAAYSDSNYRDVLRFGGTSTDAVDFQHRRNGTNYGGYTNAKLRDYGGSGWYHIVLVWNDAATIYVNGVQQSLSAAAGGLTDANNGQINNDRIHYIGARSSSGSAETAWDGQMSQIYFVDGQALGPGYFGFTDPLTGTWRPKRLKDGAPTVNDGTVWSDSLTGARTDTNLKTDAFDGSLTTKAGSSTTGTGAQLTFTSPKPIHYNSGVRVYVYWGVANDVTMRLDGGESITVPGNTWTTLVEGTGSFKTLTVNGTTNSAELSAIEVDGVIMTDATTTNVDFGTHGFYLPLDGNSPIGEDKSGKGNDWTPVNFGGSVELDKATGALPILNTTQGGTHAGVGVFGSKENKYYTVTTANGSVYQFDITSGDNPSLEFIRGATYKFDYSDHTSHGVLFSSTNPDSSTTAYTDGTSTASNVISFTVPHNAPDTLYYYCVNHPTAMNGSISVTTDETKADPYAWKCILAVPGVGGNYTDVSAQINCTSTTKASSAGGNPSSDSSPTNFYESSIDLDGDDKVTYTRTNAGDFSAQNDFTIEAWFNTDTTGATDAALFSNWDSGDNRSILFGPNASGGGKFTFIFNTTGSGSWTTVANPTAYAGKWVHVAWVYDHSATRHYAYINGILEGSATGTAYNNSTANFLLGVNKGDASGYYNGKVQDLRYYHAVKYTASGTTAGEVVFTPASTNPDILPDTPSGVSGGSKLTKITDGAVSFDGGDNTHLSIADSTDFDHASSFTWEGYFYLKSYDSSGSSILRHENDGLDWYINTSGNILFNQNTSTNLVNSGTGAMTLNKWVHIAVSHTGSVCKLFVDGVEKGSVTTSTVPDNVSGILYIGEAGDNNNYQWNGFISNLRFVNGTALYTSNFTPPTAPLTTTSQGATASEVKLLCCQKPIETPVGFTTATASGALPILNTNDDGTSVTSGNRSDDDSSSIVLALPLYNNSNDVHADIKGSGSNKTITENGNAAASSDQSQFYGGSYVFDGDADYLTIPASSDFDFGTGAYTIEMWFRTTSDAGWLFYDAGSSNQGMRLCIGNNGGTSSNLGKLQFNEQVGNGDDPQNGISLVNDGNWHHVAVCRGASGDTTKMYVDGILEATGSADRNFDNNNTVYIGQRSDGTGSDFNGYIQDIRVYKGVAKYTSNFNPVGTFLRPQFAVAPSTVFSLGNAAATTFNPFNTDINTVRGQETGYATMNPLDKHSTSATEDGNLVVSNTSNLWCGIRGTFGRTSGKFYYEVKTGGAGSGGESVFIGLGSDNPLLVTTSTPQNDNTTMAAGTVLYCDDGQKILDSSTRSSYGTAISNQDLIGVAYDLDNKTIEFFNDGISQGVIDFSSTVCGGANQIVFPYYISYYNSTKSQFNFGQKPFKFPPPDGFQPLNVANVRPETVITRPDQYVGIVTYSGEGGTQSITGYNFNAKPDFVWIKNRSDSGGTSHILFDTVRGVGKSINSNETSQERTNHNYGYLTSFDYNGYTVTGGSSGDGETNDASNTYVAWAWKAGGNKNTFNVDDVGYASAAAAGLTAGTITPTGASVNTKSGFSIIRYTGGSNGASDSVPHGLGRTPGLILHKNLGATSNWNIKHSGFQSNYGAAFTTTLAQDVTTVYSGGGFADLTSDTTFGFLSGTSNANNVNEDGADYICYIWADVPGLQKFGRYTGNGDTDGPMVVTEFRPAFIMLKRTDSDSSWQIRDTSRSPGNVVTENLYPNLNNKESTDSSLNLDILSNGFKPRTSTDGGSNASGGTYVYAAFAEAPAFNLYGAQSNAR